MKLIVGLGNPGKEYEDTRHNIGFMVVEKLAKELSNGPVHWSEDKKAQAFLYTVGGVTLVKPQTYMNASGTSVAKLAAYYKLGPDDVWVIHDDIDLPIGKIRIREHGASAGHNGMDSVIQALKTDAIVRFRLGIGRGKEDKNKHTDQQVRHKKVIEYVLSRFTQGEAGDLRRLVKHGVEVVRIALLEGVDKAMNRFN
jgi:peptidyl-tRNA hydrolase, PTH1 family